MKALILGGASSGKSTYAENLCTRLGGSLVYLAAMRPFGEEGARRVEKHRAQRAGKGFATIECYEDFTSLATDERLDGATALLECLGNVTANELFTTFDESEMAPDISELCPRIQNTIEAAARRCEHFVIVGNDVGADGVTYPAETRQYQDLLGSASCALAAWADVVVEVTAGIPVVIKAPEGFTV